ncbi:MAG: DUF86 domain-containing protein [bacterium]|nr:DUF86 domain-containing protein [bacterium]
MERDDASLVLDIRDACNRILAKTNRMTLRQFEGDEDVQDIVYRQFGKIGEAANNLSEEFLDRYRHVKWGKIVSLRNRVVHDYSELDLSRIWRIIREEVPQLLKNLEDA